MIADIPIQVVAASATIAAAVIASGLSLMTITLSKEQKVSEFRQAWIDALRGELAAFFSAARAISRAIESRNRHGNEVKDDPAKFPFTSEKIGELRHTAAESLYRIELRLNPDEAAHKRLLDLLWIAVEEQNSVIKSQSTECEEVIRSIDRASEFARPVLKSEWVRVKLGEPSFRITRTLVIVINIIVLIVFFAFVVLGKFKG